MNCEKITAWSIKETKLKRFLVRQKSKTEIEISVFTTQNERMLSVYRKPPAVSLTPGGNISRPITIT